MERLAMLGPGDSPWRIRPLTTDDVEALLYVQTMCYGPDFVESHAIFAQRLACPQQCSLGIEHVNRPGLLAYLAAYYSAIGRITPLNGDFEPLDSDAMPVLYLHDMSVLPEMAGQGFAKHLLHTLFEMAHRQGLQQAALVSVQGSQLFWEKNGFAAQPVTDEQQQNLCSYGDGAVYMAASIKKRPQPSLQGNPFPLSDRRNILS